MLRANDIGRFSTKEIKSMGFLNIVKNYINLCKSEAFQMTHIHPHRIVTQSCMGQSSKREGCQPHRTISAL